MQKLSRVLHPETRFWMQVDKTSSSSSCWNWKGYRRGKQKRAVISVKGKQILASHYSYRKFKGRIPKGKKVLHSCDNTSCVNPEHLFLGSQLDNMRDMVIKGRSHKPKGEKNGRAKLTAKSVRFIRAKYIPRHKQLGQKALAERFGICTVQIQAILTRRAWSHLN
jgi:hypothetical protein